MVQRLAFLKEWPNAQGFYVGSTKINLHSVICGFHDLNPNKLSCVGVTLP